SFRDRGGDPDIVGRLPGLFRRHGLELSHLAINERLARPGSTLWAWPDTFFASYLPRLADIGYLTREEQKAAEAAWSEACDDTASFMPLPPVWHVIAVKP